MIRKNDHFTPKPFEILKESKAISLGHTEGPVDPEDKEKKCIVTKRYVKVRRTPSSLGEVVKILEKGDTAVILSSTTNYYEIRHGLTVAYIHKDCCEEVG